MGKHKPIYDPSTDCGDYVVATDCAQLKVTGRKRQQKMYYTHTTRPGSLKSMSLERLMEKWGGGEVLRRAVRGMLPKNKLRDLRLARLKSKFCFFLRWAAEKCVLTWTAAFEGHAHPYSQNLIRYPGQNVKAFLEVPGIENGVYGSDARALAGQAAKTPVSQTVEAR